MVIFAPGRNTIDYPQGRKSESFVEKVESFRNSYKLWHLDIALNLATSNPDSGFAVLSILNPYFEIIGRHISGLTPNEAKQKVKDCALIGIDRVFPDLSTNPYTANILPLELHNGLRNSIAHIGLTGNNIILNGEYNSALTIHILSADVIVFVINPTLWTIQIYQDFYKYIGELLDENNIDLRENFEKCYTAGV